MRTAAAVMRPRCVRRLSIDSLIRQMIALRTNGAKSEIA